MLESRFLGSEVTTAFASFLAVFFAIAAVFPIAVVTAIVAVAVIFSLTAAMDAEGSFFGNLTGVVSGSFVSSLIAAATRDAES